MKVTRKQRAELDALKKLMQIQKDEAIKEGIARNRAEIQAELPALYAKQRADARLIARQFVNDRRRELETEAPIIDNLRSKLNKISGTENVAYYLSARADTIRDLICILKQIEAVCA